MRAFIFLLLALLGPCFSAEEQAILPAGGRQDLPTVQGITESPLASTAFLSGGYDRNTDTLQLTFSTGATYQFFKVDARVALLFFQARSKGGYFNAVIRNGGYNYKLIGAAQRNPAPVAGNVEPKTIGEFLDLVKQRNDWGKLRIIAKDGTFLGTLEPNKFAADSIFNDFGLHGGEFAQASIFNKFGQHGGEFAQASPFNEFATNPPMVYYQGRAIFYLTSNMGLSPALTVPQLLSFVPTP